jgi:hypothetical protein
LAILLLTVCASASAQITPPGLGENENANLWIAVGLEKKLDSPGKISSLSYVGIGKQQGRLQHLEASGDRRIE